MPLFRRSTPRGRRTAAAILALLLSPTFIAPPAAAAEPQVIADILARHAPAVVTIEAVVRTELKMGGQGEDQDSNLDLVGAVVDPSGLVMLWNSRISSSRVSDMMSIMGSAGGGPGGFGIEMTPLSFCVRLGGGDETYHAFLAASDPQLDLAFLQLAEMPEEPLAWIELAAAGGEALTVGREVFAVNRLSTSFAHAPFVETGVVVGELLKPRRAWIAEGHLQGIGLPLFDAGGRALGVLSTVLSSVAPERAAASMQAMGNMLGGGDGKTVGPLGVFVLPAADVARSVARSRERAQALLEERRESGADPGAATGEGAVGDGAEEEGAVEEGAEEPPGATEGEAAPSDDEPPGS